jgi:hypothetical protein
MTDPLDLRELDPPEPLLRIFEALADEGVDQHVFLLAREPLILYPMLADAGWRHTFSRDEHGCVLAVFREPRVP